MNAGRAILWSGVVLVGSGVVGYVFGFWASRPAIHPIAILGAVAIVVAVTLGILMFRAYFHSRSIHFALSGLSLGSRVGLVWSTVAIVASINIGALLGFIAGLRTAQAVVDVLSGAGVVAALLVTVAVLIAIVFNRRLGNRLGRRH